MGCLNTSLVVAITAVFVGLAPRYLNKTLPVKGEGFAAPGWRRVADVFRDLLDSRALKGGSIAVYHQGELVVEFVGGYADYDAEWPFQKETLTWMFSSTKAVSAVTMAVLVNRGLLDYEKPVVRYWPEFHQHGKEEITVEQLLSHQAGLVAIDENFSAYDILNDPDKLGKILAAQKPNWKPVSKHGYHGYTLGLYEDQIVRRVDPLHRSLSQFFAEEIAEPLGLDLYIGLPKEENFRCARIYPFSLNPFELLGASKYWDAIIAYLTDPESLISRVTENPKELAQDGVVNNPSFREVPSPATSGFGTAKSIAKVMGILANGGTDIDSGVSLLPQKLINKLSDPLVDGLDEVLLMNMTYSRGVSLMQNQLGGYVFGAPGSGGQMAYADPQFNIGWAFLTNYQSVHAINDDPRYLALHNAIYECAMNLNKKRE